MAAITPLLPRQPVPALQVSLLGGGDWRLDQRSPGNFTMLVFYRGRHCPVCSAYLADLNARQEQFAERGVEVLALSGDSEQRAASAREDWRLDRLAIGYGLDLDQARRWGLYLSSGRGKTSIGIEEPALFSEPGLFLVRPDRTLYWGSVQTMPFARPNFAEILKALDFVLAKDYPARGEVVDHRTGS